SMASYQPAFDFCDRSLTSVRSAAHATHHDTGAPEPPSMVRAQRGASQLAPSRSLSACQSVDIGGGQGLAPDPPVAAFHLLDQTKGDLTHVLALDRDHRVGQLGDDLALLFLTEYVLDDLNLNERHWILPLV